MMFDTICKLAEIFNPKLSELCKQAHLFLIKEGDIQNLLQKNILYDSETDIFTPSQTEIKRKFFLPFDVCAVDAEEVVYIIYNSNIVDTIKFTLWALGDLSKEGNRSEILSMSADFEIDLSRSHDDISHSNFYLLAYNIEKKAYSDGQHSDEYDREVINVLRESATKLMIMFSMINMPTNVLVKTEPLKIKSKNSKKYKKIRRSHQRPNYSIIYLDEVREKIGLDKESKSDGTRTVSAHHRKRTIRFLSHEKYRFDSNGRPLPLKMIPSGPRKGQTFYKTAIADPCFIGGREHIVGKKVYLIVPPKI